MSLYRSMSDDPSASVNLALEVANFNKQARVIAVEIGTTASGRRGAVKAIALCAREIERVSSS